MEQRFGSDLKKSGVIYYGESDSKKFWWTYISLLKSGLWISWLLTKYTFQTYGALMLTLFGLYYIGYVDVSDELVVLSHMCLFGSVICAILLVMHKTLEAD